MRATEDQHDLDEQRRYLHEVLALDPWHPEARRTLALLEGRLNPDEVINPNTLRQKATKAPEATKARRFVCVQCGGQLTFLPQGTKLHCAYCGHTVSLLQAMDEGAAIEERDFLLDLMTQRGHKAATRTRTFSCQTCGATYLSETASVAFTCPYCASAYVAELEETRDLIPPKGIIPMRLSAEEAEAAIRHWFDKEHIGNVQHLTPPRGAYLPIWTFDIGGVLIYTYQIVRRSDESDSWWESTNALETIRNEWAVLADDMPAGQPKCTRFHRPMPRLLPAHSS